MRIIIDIDGDHVNVTTGPKQTVSVNAMFEAIAAGVRPTPPPELLKAAAALGAHDAGPAPFLTNVADVVKSVVSDAELKALSGVTNAGSAPAGTDKKTPVKKAAAAKSAAASKKR